MIDVKWFYFIDILLVDFGILQYLFDGLHGLAEQVHVKLFKFSTSERLREVDTILKGLDLDAGRLLAGKSTFRLLNRLLAGKSTFRLLNLTLELAHGTEVAGDVASSFFLVPPDKVVNDAAIEILSTKVGITGSCKTSKTPSSIEE
jgi:hypothetical protein